MKNVFERVLFVVMVCMILNSATIVSHAKEPLKNDSVLSIGNEGIGVQSAELIWRFRKYNGKKQKRLWSCTDNCWVMDDWIDV